MSSAAATPMNKIERAHQMYREGRYEEALSFYTQALGMARTKPQKIALHSNRAACFLKLHDFKKAAEECTSVLELDRDHTGALMLRAQTLVTLKEYSSALFDVNRLMELNPSSEVYQNLHDRLKTQLLLAPIPEAEEELEEEEEEDECKDDTDLKGENEVKDEVVQEVEDAVYSRVGGEQKKDFNRNVTDKVNPQTPTQKENAKVQVVKDLSRSEAGSDKKIELQSNTPNAETQNTKGSAEQNSEGWKSIPKPIGHSRLDYSRWDKVEDDSSGDEDDDDEDYQPQYRFRVKTVGVRSVK